MRAFRLRLVLAAALLASAACGGADHGGKIGDTVRLGDWQYRVLEAYTSKSVDAGLHGAIVPKGTFVVVKLELTNLRDANATVNAWDLLLVDHAGVRYHLDPNATFLNRVGSGTTALGQAMPPSTPLTTMLLYDVNPEPVGWTLHLVQGNADIQLTQ